MENNFIEYQEALELKELGFDEPCLAIFNKEGKLRQSEKNIHNLSVGRYDFPIYDKKSIHYEGIRAPLYQQVIDFFREEHKLHITIDQDGDVDNEYVYSITKTTYPYQRVWQDGNHWTYSEARQEGIKRAIEYVKKYQSVGN